MVNKYLFSNCEPPVCLTVHNWRTLCVSSRRYVREYCWLVKPLTTNGHTGYCPLRPCNLDLTIIWRSLVAIFNYLFSFFGCRLFSLFCFPSCKVSSNNQALKIVLKLDMKKSINILAWWEKRINNIDWFLLEDNNPLLVVHILIVLYINLNWSSKGSFVIFWYCSYLIFFLSDSWVLLEMYIIFF